MEELLGSQTKAKILLYLGLRGGTTGRHLSRVLKITPSQIFKALQQLVRGEILSYHLHSIYFLNPHYPFYEELLHMIHKQAQVHPKTVASFLPKIGEDRRVDPLAVYELIAARKTTTKIEKFSDVLRRRYA